MTILNEYYSPTGNFISYVVQNNKGFGVSIYDLDAKDYAGFMKIFPKLLDAIAYAKKIAEIGDK